MLGRVREVTDRADEWHMGMPPTHELHYYSEERANCGEHNWYTLQDYVDAGLGPVEAHNWFDSDLNPHMALHFRRLGMSPAEAWKWGLIPRLVEGYRDLGFDESEAWSWAWVRIWPEQAALWRRAGYRPIEAVMMISQSKDESSAILWTLTGLDPRDAHEHAEGGADPALFLSPPV